MQIKIEIVGDLADIDAVIKALRTLHDDRQLPLPLPQPQVVAQAQPEPAPEVAQVPTLAELRQAAAEVAKRTGAERVRELIASYGCKTLNGLAPEHYSEFLKKLQAL